LDLVTLGDETDCLETSVPYYQSTMHNVPEERETSFIQRQDPEIMQLGLFYVRKQFRIEFEFVLC